MSQAGQREAGKHPKRHDSKSATKTPTKDSDNKKRKREQHDQVDGPVKAAKVIPQGSTQGGAKESNASSSKESHQKQKALAKERKAAKPNADTIQRAKQLWEKLRRKSHVEKEERKKLVAELFELITGNVHDYVFKHDSVRVIQCALKYANEEQKIVIATELKGEFKGLAQSKYGKFLVAKLLVTGNDTIRDSILSEFYGSVRSMINHPEASWILDDTYRQVATPKQKASLLREWYGPEFALFKASASDPTPTSDLSEILTAEPAKRKTILKYLYDLINQLVQKKLTGFTMLHDAMLQYSIAIGAPSASEAATEFYEMLKEDEDGDLLKNLAFTASGSRVVARALAFGNAKSRKLLLRAYKGVMLELAYNTFGHNVLLAAYETIDDTKMTAQAIFPELLGAKLSTDDERYNSIVEQATSDKTARVPLLYPLVVGNGKWLVREKSAAAKIIQEVISLRGETSKKDAGVRRTELAKALTDDGVLLAVIQNRADELTKSSFGCQFITEVLLSTEAEVDKSPAMTAVADLARGDPTEEGHLATSSHAGKMLRDLARGKKFRDAESKNQGPRLGFAELLYPRIKANISQWAVGPSSFLVANLLADKAFKDRGEIIKNLRLSIPQLQEASGNGNSGATEILTSW